MASATRLFCFLSVCVFLYNALDIRSFALGSRNVRFLPIVFKDNPCYRKHDTKPCGKGLCVCCDENTTAHCSSGLIRTYGFPRLLPQSVRVLRVTTTGLTHIGPASFDNMPNLTEIDLSRNSLQQVDKSSFVNLKNVKRISLKGNPLLSLSEVTKVLAAPSLLLLDAQSCNIRLPKENAFSRVSDSQLQTFVLSNMPTIQGVLNLNQFNVFTHLKELDFSHDKIEGIRFAGGSTLKTLSLESNPIEYLGTCKLDSKTSLYPKLKTLNLSHTQIDDSSLRMCLPALESLDVTDTKLDSIFEGSFAAERFPSLTNLTLGFRSLQRKIPHCYFEKHVFRNPNLRSLSISNMDIRLMHNTSSFILSGRRMPLHDRKFHLLFGGVASLTALSIEGCRWNWISIDTFAPFRQLVYLSLSRNWLVNIPDSAFDSLPYLTDLDLSGNRITLIQQDTFSEALRNRLRILRLDENPFMCTCDLEWFSGFVAGNPTLFLTRTSNYDCLNLPNTKVVDFPPYRHMCMIKEHASVLIIFTCSSFILTLTVISLVFRFRWHIRLVLYEAFRGRGANHRRMRLQANNFDWDVFVSYASEDLAWVRQHLMPELEDRLGLRLCVHERDFIPGKNIVDNIVDCVESSKKILMVFSRDFVRSQWCQFELALCLSHVMDHDDVLIIVCVDDVISRRMTSAMMAVLKITTYIQWVENDDAVRSFWGRLGQSLHEITDRRVAEDAV